MAGPVDCGDHPINIALFEYGFAYYVEDGKEQGIFKDLAIELAQRTGCQFTHHVVSIARMWEDLANGQLDMLIAGRQTQDRNHFAWFAPYLITRDDALIHVSAAKTVNSAEDFMRQKSFRFGTVRSRSYHTTQDRWLDGLRQEGRVEESSTAEILVNKLKHGHIDGLFMVPTVYRKIMRDLKITDEIVIQDWFPEDEGYIANLVLAKSRFSNSDAIHWQNTIQEMRKDGTLERIFSNYLSVEEAKEMVNFQMDARTLEK